MKDFMKFDGKKNRLELIEPEFIEGLGRILSFGAEKYEADNWKKANSPEDQKRIYGALQRHLLAYRKGEKIDPETDESHLYHACCNLMFLDYQDRVSDDTIDKQIQDEMAQEDIAFRVAEILSGYIHDFNGFDDKGWIETIDRRNGEVTVHRNPKAVETWLVDLLNVEKKGKGND